jgi:hypothetical protein
VVRTERAEKPSRRPAIAISFFMFARSPCRGVALTDAEPVFSKETSGWSGQAASPQFEPAVT